MGRMTWLTCIIPEISFISETATPTSHSLLLSQFLSSLVWPHNIMQVATPSSSAREEMWLDGFLGLQKEMLSFTLTPPGYLPRCGPPRSQWWPPVGHKPQFEEPCFSGSNHSKIKVTSIRSIALLQYWNKPFSLQTIYWKYTKSLILLIAPSCINALCTHSKCLQHNSARLMGELSICHTLPLSLSPESKIAFIDFCGMKLQIRDIIGIEENHPTTLRSPVSGLERMFWPPFSVAISGSRLFTSFYKVK